MENRPSPEKTAGPRWPALPTPGSAGRSLRGLVRNERGAVLVEAAIALPILIMLLLGIVSYGLWFMAAHSLQQAANEAARAAIAGLDSAERAELVNTSLEHSILHSGTLQPKLVKAQTGQSGNFYTVTLSYDVAESKLFATSFVPLPDDTIKREAVVQLHSL